MAAKRNETLKYIILSESKVGKMIAKRFGKMKWLAVDLLFLSVAVVLFLFSSNGSETHTYTTSSCFELASACEFLRPSNNPLPSYFAASQLHNFLSHAGPASDLLRWCDILFVPSIHNHITASFVPFVQSKLGS